MIIEIEQADGSYDYSNIPEDLDGMRYFRQRRATLRARLYDLPDGTEMVKVSTAFPFPNDHNLPEEVSIVETADQTIRSSLIKLLHICRGLDEALDDV